jgi:hypothetical protein
MPCLNLNARNKVEDCLVVSVFFLNQGKFFQKSHSGTIAWSNYFRNESIISYSININTATSYISFNYLITDESLREINIEQTILLSTTNCNYGGKRHWFICSCGKRVGVVYKTICSDYFQCRHCHNLTYESRNLSGFQKSIGRAVSIPELEKLRLGLKRVFYNGQLTKNCIKYQKKLEQFKTYHYAWLKNLHESVSKCKY